MERGDRFARGRQALLVRVGIGVGDVVGDRALQVLRRAETEGARVADVELDQLAALGLQLAGAAGEFAADLVTDFGQAFAGLQAAGIGHRGGSCGNGAGQPAKPITGPEPGTRLSSRLAARNVR